MVTPSAWPEYTQPRAGDAAVTEGRGSVSGLRLLLLLAADVETIPPASGVLRLTFETQLVLLLAYHALGTFTAINIAGTELGRITPQVDIGLLLLARAGAKQSD